MENVALFLVREVTHFNGDLVPEFCAAVFNEYTQLLNAQCIQGTTTEEQEEFVKFVSNCTSKCRSACKNIRVSVAMHLYRSADNFFQFLVAFGVFGYEALKLYEEGKKRKIAGNTESVCEASIEFTPPAASIGTNMPPPAAQHHSSPENQQHDCKRKTDSSTVVSTQQTSQQTRTRSKCTGQHSSCRIRSKI
ncbi:uncharacterized protein LOC110706258 isoform X3 [Chenopodium quinoa]|nr:uncharacterized protein LOC110706258 isoform X3 [Chenopodium quinoa]XP_021739850.1 uncharacterized protein LOC110706258 isoform X3 [Chenopodium quinoa]